MRRAGKSWRNGPRGLVSRSANHPRHAGAIVRVRRRHLPVHAGFTACRPRMNVPATGIIHVGPGSLMRTGGERRTQGPGSFAAAVADKGPQSAPLQIAIGCTGAEFPLDSAALPLGMRLCRDAGNWAMRLPSIRYQGYQAAERTVGGRKAPAASDMHGISVYCATFRAARSRSLRFQITRDSCCYRAQYCQYPISAGGSPHPRRGMESRLQLLSTR